jgi:quercetin dioxygenase-like cupin family protein
MQVLEQSFQLTQTDEKTIEKVLLDENLHYLHMVLGPNEWLPEHLTNGNVYMTVVRGRLSIGLGEQESHEYAAGTLLKIPNRIKMNAKNLHSETLELIVVKAPAPAV